MTSWRVINSQFEKGVVDPEQLADQAVPELGIVGRSNVGKSSLLNRLANNSKLARVSSTPGRTQELNSFLFDFKNEKSERTKLRVVDLPGFGYAKLSHDQRDKLRHLIGAYLSKSRPADLVLLLNDSKRGPEIEELDVRNYCFEREIPLFVILTKCDRLSRSQLAEQSRNISKAYGLEPNDLLISGDGIDCGPIWERIFLALE